MLSTGGGVVVSGVNREVIRENSYVIWLKATPEGLAKRVGNGESRPLLKGKNPLQVLQSLSKEREELYEETADFVINVENGSVRDISQQILALNILRGTND